jgi:hypothetical protein
VPVTTNLARSSASAYNCYTATASIPDTRSTTHAPSPRQTPDPSRNDTPTIRGRPSGCWPQPTWHRTHANAWGCSRQQIGRGSAKSAPPRFWLRAIQRSWNDAHHRFDAVGEISPVHRRISSAWRITPVFRKTCSRWVFAVGLVMPSIVAVSTNVRPANRLAVAHR